MDDLDAEQIRNKFKEMTEQPSQEIQTGYLGPGIWIRVSHRFRTRMTEWMLAAITALWGIIVLLPGNAFDQPDFAGFRNVFGNEVLLGSGMLILGIFRIFGLIVNGARKNVTPHIRMVSAGFGCAIFFGISYCYMLSGVLSTWIAIYPVFIIGEMTNLYRAAHDVGEANGRSH